MERLVTYERPREKLKLKGASALSTAELFQLVIGSGSSKVSGAKLARHVASLFTSQQQVVRDDLESISGLGEAKVSQILAVAELMHRKDTLLVKADADIVIYKSLKLSKVSTVYVFIFDGTQKAVACHEYPMKQQTHYSLVVKRLFSDALSEKAAAISIGLGSRMYPLEASHHDLEFARHAYRTAQLLHVPLKGFYLVNSTATRQLAKALL